MKWRHLANDSNAQQVTNENSFVLSFCVKIWTEHTMTTKQLKVHILIFLHVFQLCMRSMSPPFCRSSLRTPYNHTIHGRWHHFTVCGAYRYFAGYALVHDVTKSVAHRIFITNG